MNHIKALALANSINQDRLEAARRRRYARPPSKIQPAPRRWNLLVTLRAHLTGLRARPHPTR